MKHPSTLLAVALAGACARRGGERAAYGRSP